MYPQTIINLIECYKKLPGIGEKTAERLALATLQFDDNMLELFSKSILDSKDKIKRCKNCNHLTEGDICQICKDDARNKKMICVVEEPKNVILFEKIGTYNPMTEPSTIVLDMEKVSQWIKNGAKPTDTVKALIEKASK